MSGGNGNGRKPRLELTWIGKDERPRLEPRILLPVPEHCHAKGTADDGGLHDNMLIHGDNLLALKALAQQFAGKVKCAFIDPPFNTGQAFQQYDDGLEHSLWLSLLRDRLELLRHLLAADGSLWVAIDDNESHYLKVLCDELFGRSCFVGNVVWRSTDNSNNNALGFSLDHNHILVYSKSPDWRPKHLANESKRGHFKNPDNDPRGPWFDGNPLNNPALRPNLQFDLVSPQGHVIKHPPNGWRWSRETIEEKLSTGEMRWTSDGKAIRRRTYLADMEGLPPSSLWFDLEETGHNRQAKYELKNLFPEREVTDLFGTPKPERLIRKIMELSTNPGDIVLDSFAGSGTTGAVAHKMGRRWIMAELGEHATTHIVPRLKKVIDGQDPGGVTEATGWKGGGGFRFYKLAPSLIAEDQFGQKIISKEYQPEMLVEAMCKHMGYTYAPAQDRQLFWQQGYSTERDFIYVTTQSLTHDALKALSLEVGPERTLLVCCKAFRARLGDFENLTVKKIPQAVLENCEWGRDDYSLNIAKPPEDTEPDDSPDDDDGNGGDEPVPRRRGRPRRAAAAEPVTETRAALAAPVKKAPLKMDGTTRQPHASKAAVAPAEPPPAAPARTPTTAAPIKTKDAAASKKAAKTKDKSAGKAATKKAKAKPAPKTKSRRGADDRQGRLL